MKNTDSNFSRQLKQMARQLQYLMEGVLVMAHMHGPADQALEAREAADILLRSAGL